MKRSKNENSELGYTVRINGRAIAAFRRGDHAEDFTHKLSAAYPDADVECWFGDNSILRLNPRAQG